MNDEQPEIPPPKPPENDVHSEKFESKLDNYFKSGTKEKDHASRRSSVKIEGQWT